jgi:hypothetical protein
MEINMKLADVLTLNRTLKSIIDNNDKVEALFKFKLLGIMKSIENYVANFEVIRNEKINEYGTKTEDGQVTIPPDDKETIKKFNDDMLKIIESEVTVNITKLNVKEVFDNIHSSEYLIGLYPIIEE